LLKAFLRPYIIYIIIFVYFYQLFFNQIYIFFSKKNLRARFHPQAKKRGQNKN